MNTSQKNKQEVKQQIEHVLIHGSLVLCVVEDYQQWIHLGQYLAAVKSPLTIGIAAITVIVKVGPLHIKTVEMPTLTGSYRASYVSWTAIAMLRDGKKK